MEIATSPEPRKVEPDDPTEEAARDEFETFLVTKFHNLETRLIQLIVQSKFEDATKERLKNIVTPGIGFLLKRSSVGELNALLMTMMVFNKHYNAETDQYDMKKLVDESVASGKELLDTLLQNNPDSPNNSDIQDLLADYTLYEELKDEAEIQGMLTVAAAYIKMLCQLSQTTKK